jgi:hypothetical protein
MTTIINGTSSAITFPDSTVQNTAYNSSTVIAYSQLPSGTILQVVSTAKTNAFFLAGGETWTDVTGFSATITPKSSSSRIFICVTASSSFSEQDSFGFSRILRNSTAIGFGDARGSSTTAGMNLSQQNAGTTQVWSLPSVQNFVDSPATTSAVTYKIQAWCRNSRNLCIGGSYDSSDLYRASVPSTITLMEIA